MTETLIFSTGSVVTSGSLVSTASISQLNLDGVSGSFTGTFVGGGAGLDGIVSVSHAANADTAVLAVSSVTALTASHVAGGNVFGAVGLADTASFLLGSIESASFATFATTAASASDVAYNDVRDKPTLISSSAQITSLDLTDDLIVSGNLQVLGSSSLANLTVNALTTNGNLVVNGVTDMIGDLEVQVGFGIRIGHSAFIQGPDPTSIPQSSSLHELQVIGGNDVPPSSMMIAQFSNTGSNGPFMIFGKSGGNGIGSFSRPLDQASLGGLLWGIADGFSTTLRVHAASIKARADGFTPTAGFAGAELIFSVAQNISANDITEAMRIRKNLTLDLFGPEIVSGSLLVLGSSSLAQTSVEGATGSFTGTFIGDFTGSTSFTGSFTGGLVGTASVAQTVVGGGTPFSYFDVDKIPDGVVTSSLNDEFTETTLNPKWQPFNTGSVVQRLDGDHLFRLSSDDVTSEFSRYAQLVPSGSWVMRCKVSFEGPFEPEAYVGLFIENAVNSRLEQLSYGHSFTGGLPRKQLLLWTNPTTFASVPVEDAIDEENQSSPAYFEIAYDGVNIDYRTSWGGLSFPEIIATRTTGSHLLGAPTRLGFMWFNSAAPFSASIDWFRIASQSADLNGGLRTVG